MRVFQIEGEWGMDHLKLSTRAEPQAGPGQVVVKMKASSLNYRDLVVPNRGYGSHTGNLPLIPVSDGAGVVTEVGARAVVIATGVSYRRLDVPGTEALTGAGVYYGAGMTEGQSVRGEDVYIVGGANSAGQAAVYFADYARTVYMLVRGESLAVTMSHYLVERLQATENICIRTCTQVTGAMGNEHLEALILTDTSTGQAETVPASSLFIFIGARPHTDWLGQEVLRDQHCFVVSGRELMDGDRPRAWPLQRLPYTLETSVPGVFVAGDVRQGSIKRVASAVGEGSIVVQFVHRYLAEV